MDVEPVEQVDEMSGEADGDAHVGEGVFEDEIPADDPGDKLAEHGIGVGVSGAGNGDHAGELGITEAGATADGGDEEKRDGEGGTCAGPAGDGSVMEQEIDDGRSLPVADLGRVTADGGANDREDAGTDDDAYAEGGEGDRS